MSAGLLIFGRTGQLALALSRLAPEATFLGREQADLRDPAACAAAIRKAAPLAVINAAAYTAVDRAEEDRDTAWRVNAHAPAAMAETCAALDVPFIHVSSDYVLDGTGNQPRHEDAATNPLGVYGASKLAGEQAVARQGGRWAVLRTSWVFSADGANFVKTMLRLAASRDQVGVVMDQIGGPTPAARIAEALLIMTDVMLRDRTKGGIYHFAGAPDVSWADFARAVFAEAKMTCRVQDISTADYPTAAERPLNSRLDCGRITRDFGISRPDWRADLQQVLQLLETS
ncbi:dTDP-4-dehydrorhamnose reductase [Paracoccus sp. (in: a-proteobacteria)]|uniref:dTDP-4-dehydrorhamnose reductase n=1 Tax=Paracoccus sp. TaxID=267 RepID=UPI00396CD047